MTSLTCAEMRQLEHTAFKKGSTAEELMEKAGLGIARAIQRRHPHPGNAIACIGTGNNGGDALVALRHLAGHGWSISIQCLHPTSKLSVLSRKKWRQLRVCPLNDALPDRICPQPLILLDGLLGIGASGPLREPLKEMAELINTTRQSHGAEVIAIDIPSGMNGDSGVTTEGAVIADLTLTVGVPKTGLLAPHAVHYTGTIESIPLAELPHPDNLDSNRPCLNDIHSLQNLLPRRPHDFHKGNAGHVGILAGSRGMLGAAVLCATGAIRSGAGLVTLFTEEIFYPTLAAMLPPEVMLIPINSMAEIHNKKLDALALGPGIGTEKPNLTKQIADLLEDFDKPIVLDADGLNLIAANDAAQHIHPNITLTPHPGEMARLFPQWAEMSRLEQCHNFTNKFTGSTLLLKGARSLIAKNGTHIYVNGTGNAGMAAGGQGDVLTGVIAALLAQGLRQFDAARLGAWLCGRASELAISHGQESTRSLCAGDVPNWLGMAFREMNAY